MVDHSWGRGFSKLLAVMVCRELIVLRNDEVNISNYQKMLFFMLAKLSVILLCVLIRTLFTASSKISSAYRQDNMPPCEPKSNDKKGRVFIFRYLI